MPGSTLTDAWPLFGLRLRTEHLVLRMPTDDDLPALLAVAKAGIHPPDEMPFGVAWTSLEGAAFDRGFMQHYWGTRGDVLARRLVLNLMVEPEGGPIGAQSVRAGRFAVYRTVDTGSWLGRRFQGRGLGKEMRAAVLGFAFDGLGAEVAETSRSSTTLPSNGVSRALGYEENGFGSLAPEGVARVTQKFRMTAEGWRSRPRPPLAIEGLDGIRELFGACDHGRPAWPDRRLEPAAGPSAAAARRAAAEPAATARRRTTTVSCRSSRAPTSSRRRPGCPSPRRGRRRCRRRPSS